MAYNRLNSSASPPKRSRRSSISFSSCFGGSAYDDKLPPSSPQTKAISFSSCFGGSAYDDELRPSSPQTKQGCSGIVSPIGRHRRRHTGDFRYDSFNYALNFDDGADQEEIQLPNFTSRLPQSPPPQVVKITCS